MKFRRTRPTAPIELTAKVGWDPWDMYRWCGWVYIGAKQQQLWGDYTRANRMLNAPSGCISNARTQEDAQRQICAALKAIRAYLAAPTFKPADITITECECT